jgi:hypothetical protein
MRPEMTVFYWPELGELKFQLLYLWAVVQEG